MEEVKNFLLSLNMVNALLVCYAILSNSFECPQLASHYNQINGTILSLPYVNNRIRVDVFLNFRQLLGF